MKHGIKTFGTSAVAALLVGAASAGASGEARGGALEQLNILAENKAAEMFDSAPAAIFGGREGWRNRVNLQFPNEAIPEPELSLSTASVYETIEIDKSPEKPAFILSDDINGDGFPELVVSKFAGSGPTGSGALDIYSMEKPGDPNKWKKQRVADNIKFPNMVTLADVNGDSRPDILLPYGFLACMPGKCGGIEWIENTGGGWARHTIITGFKRFFHRAAMVDMNGDGIKDILAVGEEKGLLGGGSAEVYMFKGSGSGVFSPEPELVAAGMGALFTVGNPDGDGDTDMISPEYFGRKDSFAWLENFAPGVWKRHVIDSSSGGGMQITLVPNLYGDGKLKAVATNHTNTSDDQASPESGVFVFDIPPNPAGGVWPKTKISEGIKSRKSPLIGPQGAPGPFDWGDADGDGDTDVLVHGDGDPRVFLLEQVSPGRFRTVIIAGDVPQGAAVFSDTEKDGIPEVIVSSYENNRLLLLKKAHAAGY